MPTISFCGSLPGIGIKLVLSLSLYIMGVSGWLYLESKSFKFAVEEGVSVLLIFERSRSVLCSVFLGKISMSWLLETVEALPQA